MFRKVKDLQPRAAPPTVEDGDNLMSLRHRVAPALTASARPCEASDARRASRRRRAPPVLARA
jgi:hypothetical protein